MKKSVLKMLEMVIVVCCLVSGLSTPVNAASKSSKPKLKATVWHCKGNVDDTCVESVSKTLSVKKGIYTLTVKVESTALAKGVKLATILPKTISAQSTSEAQFVLSSTNADNVIRTLGLRNKGDQDLRVKYIKNSAYVISPCDEIQLDAGKGWCREKANNKFVTEKGAKLWSSCSHRYDGRVKRNNGKYDPVSGIIFKIRVY